MPISKDTKIYIAGHTGLVGSAIQRILLKKNYKNILTRTHKKLNLKIQKDTLLFFKKNKPDIVFMSAATVGGINANNSYPADFLLDNLQIQTNIFEAAHKYGVKKLFFLGSSCIYPKKAKQPISENSLLSGNLEKTNQSYAIAKISGIEACRAFNFQYNTNWTAIMPSNLYGPGDNYNLNTSHVLPALIKKIHIAKINNKKNVSIWGSGEPKREFLYVDDLADCLIFLMNINEKKYSTIIEKKSLPLINVGSETEIKIIDLAKEIAKVIGFKGGFIFDRSKPDGTYRKVMNLKKIRSLNWKHKISLKKGLKLTYLDYLSKQNK